MAALTSEKSERGYNVQENEITPACVGLESYKEDQSNIFFGREEEKNELYRVIKKSNLIVFFGKSGTGKTSLLNAGVFPLLRKNHYFPFRIRFELNDEDTDLVRQVKEVLITEISRYKFRVNVQPQNETLYEYFHKERLWDIITPVLIFDQFEEIFTLTEQSKKFKKKLHALMDELADLIENNIPESVINKHEELNFNYQKPKAKVVFSFREDYLPEVESLIKTVLPFYHSRYRLLPMNGSQASEVITKTWKDRISRNETSKIINFLTHEDLLKITDEKALHEKYETIDIEPSLLSQVSFFLEQKRRETNDPTISAELLGKVSKDEILKAIYEADLKKCQNETLVAEFIEENLITETGARNKFPIDAIDEAIKADIGVLKQVYLIRFENNNIELIHDVLTSVIKQKRDARRSRIALAEAKDTAGREVYRHGKMILGSILLVGVLILIFVAAFSQQAAVKALRASYNYVENQKIDLEKTIQQITAENSELRSLLTRQKTDYDRRIAIKDSINNRMRVAATRLREEMTRESRREIERWKQLYKKRDSLLTKSLEKSKMLEKNVKMLEKEQNSNYSIIIYTNNKGVSYPALKRKLEEAGFKVVENHETLLIPDKNELFYSASIARSVAGRVAGIINQCCGLPLLRPELRYNRDTEKEIKIMIK